jgi:hypothetical protein
MRDDSFLSMAAVAIYDEFNIMWHGFDCVSIEHCSREANQLAP